MSKTGTATDNPDTGNRNRSATVSPTVCVEFWLTLRMMGAVLGRLAPFVDTRLPFILGSHREVIPQPDAYLAIFLASYATDTRYATQPWPQQVSSHNFQVFFDSTVLTFYCNFLPYHPLFASGIFLNHPNSSTS
jgi:hypothetical protein